MSSITLNGDTSGSVQLTIPAVAGSSVITVPSGTGTAAVQGVSTNIVQGTVQNSTSGTAILFTGIPSYAKRITVLMRNISTSGTNSILVQIGSGSVTTTGYNAAGSGNINSTAPALVTSSSGFPIYFDTAADARSIVMQIYLSDSFNYLANHTGGGSTNRGFTVYGGGSVTLSGALDRVNITTVGGTDTFDAGSINILYE